MSSSSSSSSSSIDQSLYDKLKAEYDDYIESSKELEIELENELENERRTSQQLQQRLTMADDRLIDEGKKSSILLLENTTLHSKCSSIADKLNESEASKRVLESGNEDLSAQIRILESTIEDLRHKLDNAEEDIVFLQTDIDELKWSRQETEQRLNSEILDLQAKLESVNSQSTPHHHHDTNATSSESKQSTAAETEEDDNIPSELELEVEELRMRLIEVEQQNIDLNNEVTNMTDELLEYHEKAHDLNQLVDKLNQQVDDLNSQIEHLRKSTKSTDPIESKDDNNETSVLTEVNDKILQMEKLNCKLMQQAAEVKEAQDEVIKELEEKVMFLSTKASSVENDRNELLLSIERTERLRETEKKGFELEINKLNDECKQRSTIHHQTPLVPMVLNGDSAVTKALMNSTLVSASAAQQSNDPDFVKDELKKQAAALNNLRDHNAKLLHRLQSVLGNIQVYCRPRPPLESESTQKICVDVLDNCEVTCFDNRAETWRSFVYDRVWAPDATQSNVFADIEPMILSVVEGFNTCLLAYGQTGSGKTYTMNGYDKEYGISYRSLNAIFTTLTLKKQRVEKDQMKNELLVGKLNELKNNVSDISDEKIESILHGKGMFTYSVNVSMVEIYNEQLRDLLIEGPPSGANLEIRQAADGSVHIPGLNTVKVNSIDDVMKVFARGSAIRATSATNVNEHSSRSHSILVVEVTTCVEGSSPVKAKLFLVDLAGSERVAKSGVSGTALTEAKYINKSLSALGDVMEALDQKAKHVPYRNSKLTFFLQDSLGGNSRTMMIVTTCPTDYSAEETLFTLQFAARVRNINVGPAKRNFNTKNLEEAVKLLKAEIGSSQKQTKKMEDQITELKRENKRLSEKNNEIKIRAFDELKKINSITSPVDRVTKERIKSSPNDSIKTPKPNSSPANDDNADNVIKVKDRQSIGSRISKVPVPARTPPFKGTEAEPEAPKLSSASFDSNSSNHKEVLPSSSSSSSVKINSSRLKPRSEVQFESTPKKSSTVKEEVPESSSNADNIKTSIDLATRRRIAERSAVTLQKHKERMEARRKQHDEVLVAVRR